VEKNSVLKRMRKVKLNIDILSKANGTTVKNIFTLKTKSAASPP
jgi:hypothetical protein